MDYHIVSDISRTVLPGRAVKKSIGKDGKCYSDKMTFGRTMFSLQFGVMEPHHHAEEIIYVLDTQKGIVRYGSTSECTEGYTKLEPGMVLHFHDQEWHAFEFEQPDGYSDILFYYAQVDDLRPEEK